MTDALVIPDAIMIAVRNVVPDVKETALARCAQAGLTGEDLILSAHLVQSHGTTFVHIARWAELGMTIDRIQTCLEYRDQCGFQAPTIASLNRYLDAINFSAESVDDVLDAFKEVWESHGLHYPMHWLWHRIEEVFGGDVIRAYHMVTENPRAFLRLILGQSSPEAESLREAYSEAYSWGENNG